MKTDVPQALLTVYRGLAIHKTSHLLFSRAIDLELQNIGKEGERQSMCIKRLHTLTNTLLESIDDCSFLLECVEKITPYQFTVEIQSKMCNYVLNKYKNEELMWHRLAQREAKGRC